MDLSTLSHIKTACSVQVKQLLLEPFLVAVHFIFFLSNDLESYKKEACIHPIDFIRKLKQSQTDSSNF